MASTTSSASSSMLDAFAGTEQLLARAAETYSRWRACEAEIEELECNEQEKLRLADLWSFQRKEIEQAALKAGEDGELENERRRLQNVVRLEEAATAAYAALYDSEESAFARLRLAERNLEDLARIDPSLAPAGESLKPASYAVEEASYTLRDYLSHLEASPERLEEIESRLALLDRLKRKYGSSIEQMLAYLDEIKAQLGALENSEQRRISLRKELANLAEAYEAVAAELTRRRRDAARRLEKQVEEELASLAMERTSFRIQISRASWSGSGADEVCFLVSPNVGEEPRPLEKVASGGEISRIALALKSCVAAGSAASKSGKSEAIERTLVFDEVDAGIGGRAAEAVGRRLKQLAASNQVLCVTHLPQIAGFADHHYYVEKKEMGGRAVAVIEELAGDARTREIGRMLSGLKLTPEALKHAEKLIQTGSTAKHS